MALQSRLAVSDSSGEQNRPTVANRQLPDLPIWDATAWKVRLALLPTVVMLTMHATIIRAIMTAYSTEVGPSSLRRNWGEVFGKEGIHGIYLISIALWDSLCR